MTFTTQVEKVTITQDNNKWYANLYWKDGRKWIGWQSANTMKRVVEGAKYVLPDQFQFRKYGVGLGVLEVASNG